MRTFKFNEHQEVELIKDGEEVKETFYDRYGNFD